MTDFPAHTTRERAILLLFLQYGTMSSSQLHERLFRAGDEASLVTIKRELSQLHARGFLESHGAGRSTAYGITPLGRLFLPLDAHKYAAIDPDKRYGLQRFSFGLFDSMEASLLSVTELKQLQFATAAFRERSQGISETLRAKELERFVIELSWKSSKIEGNTYTLLDTEKLVLRGIEAPGHDRLEAKMILNHKDALGFILKHKSGFQNLTRANMEEVHKLLVAGMGVSTGLRSKPVGVTGSIYRPLDNPHQVGEAVESLCKAAGRMASPFEKALLAILGISYIQPFEDGNKRTARLLANAILLAYGCAPLSYRSVDEDQYREAVLVFYELNSIIPFKQIFIEQYTFAANNYTLGSFANE
jgi:Fic family protein